ncbi:hypothetical protein AB4138_17285 [Vibrio sp. 10N.286.52.C3]|uniref:hypothetical protein n=1 Tax=Vibrio sp. 10N.286.52.C3 TaxID=3229713 RepID=UPI00354B21C9
MNSTLPKSFFQEYEQFGWYSADSQMVKLSLEASRKPRLDIVQQLLDRKNDVDKDIRTLEQSLNHFQVDTLSPIRHMAEESYQAAIAPLAMLSSALEHGLDAALPLATYEVVKLRYDSGNTQWVCNIQDMPIPADSHIIKTVPIDQINNQTKKHKKDLDLTLMLVCWWLNTHGTLDVKANEKLPSNSFIEFISWIMHDGRAEPNSIQRMLARLEIKADTFKDN